MAYYVHAIAAGQLEFAPYAFWLFVGALPDALLLLQRRGLGRRGLRTRRRRSGGIFGALGALMLVFLIGPLVILALVAYVVYKLLSGRRGR